MTERTDGGPIEALRAKLRADVAREVEYLQRDLPLKTQDAFVVLRVLGFVPDRRKVDQGLERGDLEIDRPTGRWQWDLDALTDFAMILERLRAWAPGWHDSKKTPWELEAEAQAPDTGLLNVKAVLDEMPLDELVLRLAETGDVQQEHLLEIGIDRRLPKGCPDNLFVLLGDIGRADSAEARRVIAERFLTLAREAGYVEKQNDG